VGFWRGLERLIARVFGVTRRDDEAMARAVLADDPAIFGPHLETVRQQVARQGRARAQAHPCASSGRTTAHAAT
jgi:hypothetical protein